MSATLGKTSDSWANFHLTLKTMLILALIGMPLVLAYTAWAHVVFKGKETSY